MTANAGKIVVCWFGLWVFPISFARTLLFAIPALAVRPSLEYNAERRSDAIRDAAANLLMHPQSQYFDISSDSMVSRL